MMNVYAATGARMSLSYFAIPLLVIVVVVVVVVVVQVSGDDSASDWLSAGT